MFDLFIFILFFFILIIESLVPCFFLSSVILTPIVVCIVLSLFRCTGSAVFTHLVMHVYIKLNVVCRFLFLSLRDLVVADGWCTCSSNDDGMIAYLIVLYNMVFFFVPVLIQ